MGKKEQAVGLSRGGLGVAESGKACRKKGYLSRDGKRVRIKQTSGQREGGRERGLVPSACRTAVS